MTNQEEKKIIEKLKAQRTNVRPSRNLLTSILAQLSSPASPQGVSFWWFRLAIPAGVALLIGIVFFNMQGEPAQVAQVPSETSQPQTIQQQALLPQPERVLSMVSLATEEEAMEQVFAQQKEFFEVETTSPSLESRNDKVLAQIESFEQMVLETASSRATLIQENLAEFSSAGANVQELETLLADAQAKILEASGILESLKKDLRSKETDETLIHNTRDTLKTVRDTVRGVYEIFRAIARETKNL